MLDDPSDAADTTQEVFIKVFRGIKRFNADSSLKTWIYRIALHEASNHRRWHFRHKQKETSIEPRTGTDGDETPGIKDLLIDDGKSPLDNVYDEELKARVELELRNLPEPYRTTVILRDIEELSYEQIAEVMDASLGTVKSRLVRGRDALRKRLERHMPAFGVTCAARTAQAAQIKRARRTRGRGVAMKCSTVQRHMSFVSGRRYYAQPTGADE